MVGPFFKLCKDVNGWSILPFFLSVQLCKDIYGWSFLSFLGSLSGYSWPHDKAVSAPHACDVSGAGNTHLLAVKMATVADTALNHHSLIFYVCVVR